MLTETQISNPILTPNVTAGPGPTARFIVPRNVATFAQFLAIAVQFGLIVLVLSFWHVENLSLVRLMQLAFAGFVVHHFLPLRFRLPFFALLSVVAVVMGVGHLGPNVVTG